MNLDCTSEVVKYIFELYVRDSVFISDSMFMRIHIGSSCVQVSKVEKVL